MKIKIITDSSSDLKIEEAQKLGVELVPLTLSFDDKVYKDGVDIDKDMFYNLLINEKKYPKTSQPSPEEFVYLFKEAKKNGETVLVLPIAKALSGTYNSATIAKQIVEYEDIHIIDTCTTIAGLQLMVLEAIKNSANMTIEQLVNHLNEFKKRIVVYACINTLEYLSKGGRLSGMEAKIGDLLSLKPVITFKEDGAISIISKSIGKIRANSSLLKLIKATPIDSSYPIYYYYSNKLDNLQQFKDKLKKEDCYLEGIDVNLSPVVGCHIGDNAYGIVYVKESLC